MTRAGHLGWPIPQLSLSMSRMTCSDIVILSWHHILRHVPQFISKHSLLLRRYPLIGVVFGVCRSLCQYVVFRQSPNRATPPDLSFKRMEMLFFLSMSSPASPGVFSPWNYKVVLHRLLICFSSKYKRALPPKYAAASIVREALSAFVHDSRHIPSCLGTLPCVNARQYRWKYTTWTFRLPWVINYLCFNTDPE